MRYRITHKTRYDYSTPVAVCQNMVRLKPRSFPGHQCLSHTLRISPVATGRASRFDFFGNHVEHFNVLSAHTSLDITSQSEVDVTLGNRLLNPGSSWETVQADVQSANSIGDPTPVRFLYPSPLVRTNDALGRYAQQSFTPGRPIVDALIELTSRIKSDFEFDNTATTVTTPLEEAFENRKGVCQDFAHLQIGMLRSIGLSASYISGYLRTEPPPGQPRLVGADASHAWLAVYCGEQGWIEVDPTNDVVCESDHLRVAWGRDYSDIAPIQGIFTGGGHHSLSVSVDVNPLTPVENQSNVAGAPPKR